MSQSKIFYNWTQTVDLIRFESCTHQVNCGCSKPKCGHWDFESHLGLKLKGSLPIMEEYLNSQLCPWNWVLKLCPAATRTVTRNVSTAAGWCRKQCQSLVNLMAVISIDRSLSYVADGEFVLRLKAVEEVSRQGIYWCEPTPPIPLSSAQYSSFTIHGASCFSSSSEWL